MNSFLYDPSLLERFLVVAQEKPNPSSLNQTALGVLDNLRGQLSSLKAAQNPTFNDIESLDRFKQWAKTTEANSQGNLLVDNDKFNLAVLEQFLVDLRDRFASNADFSESLANLIDQSNKQLGTKIPLYKPKEQPKPKEEAKPKDKETSKLNLSVGVGSDGLPQEKLDTATTPPLTKTPGTIKDIAILNGLQVDFNNVYDDARRVSNDILAAVPANLIPRVAPYFNQIISKIRNLQIYFESTTSISPGLNTLNISPDESVGAVISRIQSIFNAGVSGYNATIPGKPQAYQFSQLGQISTAFGGLMEEIVAFYSAVKMIPMFQNSPEVDKQIEWARNYNRIFMDAAGEFASKHQNAARPNLH